MAQFGPSDWFPKAEAFGYYRLSDGKQTADDRRVKTVLKKETLKRQQAEVDKALKSFGLKPIKAKRRYADIGSGTNPNRKDWLRLIADVVAHDGPAYIVVKDPSRWARDVDAAVEAWAPLKRKGIPVFAVVTGIQTGTQKEKRPTENFFFLLNSGFAAQVSETQQKKGIEAFQRQMREGVLAGQGFTLYPFAREDPLLILRDNMDLLQVPKKEGGGAEKLKELVMLTAGPNGPANRQAVERLRPILRQIMEMPIDEQNTYYDVRKKIRDYLIQNKHDPWARAKNLPVGKIHFPSRALLRMTGLYLNKPWDGWKPPTDADITEYTEKFSEYLSDKDKKRRGRKAL